jgi:hypothetical protein
LNSAFLWVSYHFFYLYRFFLSAFSDSILNFCNSNCSSLFYFIKAVFSLLFSSAFLMWILSFRIFTYYSWVILTLFSWIILCNILAFPWVAETFKLWSIKELDLADLRSYFRCMIVYLRIFLSFSLIWSFSIRVDNFCSILFIF